LRSLLGREIRSDISRPRLVIIRLAAMTCIRLPLSLRQVEDLLDERGIDISHETVRVWWNRFGPMFAAEIRKKRSGSMRANTQWRWHLDEVFVQIDGATCYLWRLNVAKSGCLDNSASTSSSRGGLKVFTI
jgi:transposase-like protein